ncbi:hypothetical protein J2S74_002859 [Evansella vedderi]|uniref:Uncharacterized protein n=1 Tax=Evansella vedderi TaxID=38282 RepID=A0ABT9ZXL5_9BACI|nr:hypothetical protein [Evansella vedderi]MDQ0255477.1 hypothetical protein [Evansella vedderi]
MVKSIESPLVVGDLVNEGELAWFWWVEEHSRLAIVGDNQKTVKRRMTKSISQSVVSRDPNAVYWITGEEDQSSVQGIHPLESIMWVEEFPDPPEDFEDRHVFINQRLFFATSFLNLLARKKGMDRRELLPGASYRGHMEGPIIGFGRALERMEESPHKTWLAEQFDSLTQIDWYKTQEGFKYHLNRSGDLEERALSFLKAAWSFWTFIAQQDVPQQFLLIVEPPKELLLPDVDPGIRDIMKEAISILNYLTEVTTTTLILSSEAFFPIPELNFRHKLFFETANSDLDFWDPVNRESIDIPDLYRSWERGENEVGMWEDAATGERYLARFREAEIAFDDELLEQMKAE